MAYENVVTEHGQCVEAVTASSQSVQLCDLYSELLSSQFQLPRSIRRLKVCAPFDISVCVSVDLYFPLLSLIGTN